METCSLCLGLDAFPSLTEIVLHVTLSLVGVLPPLGVYDPLGLIETRDMRRYEIMVRSEVWIYSKSIRILRYL